MTPIPIWEGIDRDEQRALYENLLSESTPQAGYHHKKTRRLSCGPALFADYCRVGSLPVDLRQGPPLVIADKIDIPVGWPAQRIFCLGNVSMPAGYPISGARGALAAEYILRYKDGGEEHVPLRNGIKLTTAFGNVGPSRIDPIAPCVERAMRYSYDLNWEHYVVNLFTMRADPSRVLASVGIRILDPDYVLLLYGMTVQKPKPAQKDDRNERNRGG